MTKYKITRKYPMEQYGNLDISAEELETIEEVEEELKRLDKVAKDYKTNEDKPSLSLRCGNDWFIYNQKENKLFKKEPDNKKPLIKGIDVPEITKDSVPF